MTDQTNAMRAALIEALGALACYRAGENWTDADLDHWRALARNDVAKMFPEENLVREPERFVLGNSSVSSDDLPPPFTAPWLIRPGFDELFEDFDSSILEGDDPDEMRMAGADYVASGLIALAEGGLADRRKMIRQAARLLFDHFAEGDFRHDTVDGNLGLLRRDGRPQLPAIDRRGQRDEILREVIGMCRWDNHSPPQAARAIREAFEDYEATGWLIDKNSKTRPQGDLRAQFWRILKLGLHYSLPSIQTMTGMVEAGRA